MEYKKYSLAVGTVLKNGKYDYKITDVLGSGSFGITYKVSAFISLDNISTTVTFAVKEFFLKGCYRGKDGCTVVCPDSLQSEYKNNLRAFFNEGNLLRKLCQLSKNIIHVNEVFKCFDTAYYVMEYIERGNLEDWVSANGPFEEESALDMIKKVATTVEILHSHHLLHLDIKPSNIMLTHDSESNKVVPILVDFGLAKQFETDGKPTTSVIPKGATDSYAPKEQYADITHFNPAIDVYSLAATLLFLLTGNHPKSAFEIKPQDIVKELGTKTSTNTRNAILKAMNPDIDSRTQTAEAFKRMLKEGYHNESDITLSEKRNTNVFEKQKNTTPTTTNRKKTAIFAISAIVIALTCFILWTNSKEKNEDINKPENEIVEINSDTTDTATDVSYDSLSTKSKNVNQPEEQTHVESQEAHMSSDFTQKSERGNNDKDYSTGKQGIGYSKTVTTNDATNDDHISSNDNATEEMPDDNSQNVNAEESQRRKEAEELMRQHEINSLLKQ